MQHEQTYKKHPLSIKSHAHTSNGSGDYDMKNAQQKYYIGHRLQWNAHHKMLAHHKIRSE